MMLLMRRLICSSGYRRVLRCSSTIRAITQKYTNVKHAVYVSGCCLTTISLGYCFLKNPNVATQIHLHVVEGTPTKGISSSNPPKDVLNLAHLHVRPDLPNFTVEEVLKHDCISNRVWVSYGAGVYDITEFVPCHPGGEKILLGAGRALDPFWAIYPQHKTDDTLNLLETFRIGNIVDVKLTKVDAEVNSRWLQDPERGSSSLKKLSDLPFNAETPAKILGNEFYTPNEHFYVRNHLPVPRLDIESFELNISSENGLCSEKKLSFHEILKYPQHTVTAAIMCGGNRRSEMASVKPVNGLPWGPGAVGNAKWTGVKLRDLLLDMGVTPNENMHVIFEGADKDPTAKPYSTSIPLSKAMDERGDVILAFHMNGEPLTADHGFPLRVIVPGTVGARNVKWLKSIKICNHESDSFWQQKDYKVFGPSTDWSNAKFEKAFPIQAMPVTSAICSPTPMETIDLSKSGAITVRGYAWSGGGRRILRVDVTVDAGKTWHEANIEQGDEPDGRQYAWSLWSVSLPVSKQHQELEIWCKAVDSAHNVQPESFENIWNLRGLLANAYHRVKIKLINE